MELGEKLKRARLEAGLSQRQLCADEITRNMLSQIENGAARPSMDTLRYLAGRLGKTVSYFLEEDAVTSPNQQIMAQARDAFLTGDFRAVEETLGSYREPDPVFDPERQLLGRLAVLGLAESAEKEGKHLYAAQLLEQQGRIDGGYCSVELERRRGLLLGKLRSRDLQTICDTLPGLDEELLLRARAAMERRDFSRAEHLLEAAENHDAPEWKFFRAELHFAREQYREAAECYHACETVWPGDCIPRLERCYRELGNFERAYFYACRQREEEKRGETE